MVVVRVSAGGGGGATRERWWWGGGRDGVVVVGLAAIRVDGGGSQNTRHKQKTCKSDTN